MQHKTKSQSKALENLVGSIPVKERQKLSEIERFSIRSESKENNYLAQVKLDLEIATYWALSKYVQSQRKYKLYGKNQWHRFLKL